MGGTDDSKVKSNSSSVPSTLVSGSQLSVTAVTRGSDFFQLPRGPASMAFKHINSKNKQTNKKRESLKIYSSSLTWVFHPSLDLSSDI